MIADRLTDEPLGITSLRHLDPVMGTAQIGTWVRRQSWGAGVNAEAKGLLLAYVFRTPGPAPDRSAYRGRERPVQECVREARRLSRRNAPPVVS